MANDFQRRKIYGVFHAMDADGDGFLQESDFAALTARWTSMRPPADHEVLAGVMTGWWTVLRDASDENRDDKVTLDEVLGVGDVLPDMVEAVHGTARAMFAAVDADHDGRVTPAEYRDMIRAWTGQDTDTDAVFAEMDGDGDGHLTEVEFVGLWTEFWAGADETAPGRLVFGRFD